MLDYTIDLKNNSEGYFYNEIQKKVKELLCVENKCNSIVNIQLNKSDKSVFNNIDDNNLINKTESDIVNEINNNEVNEINNNEVNEINNNEVNEINNNEVNEINNNVVNEIYYEKKDETLKRKINISFLYNQYSEYLNREIEKSMINDLKKMNKLSLTHFKSIENQSPFNYDGKILKNDNGNKIFISLNKSLKIEFENENRQLYNPMNSITSFEKEFKKNIINENSLIKIRQNNKFPGILHFILFSLENIKSNKELISVKIEIDKNIYETQIFKKEINNEIKYYTKIKIKNLNPIKVKINLQKHRKPTFLNSKTVKSIGTCKFEIRDLLAYSNNLIKLESNWESKKYFIKNKFQGKFTAYLSYISNEEIANSIILPPYDFYTLNKWLIFKKKSNKLLFAGYLEVNFINKEWEKMYAEWYGFLIKFYDIHKNFNNSLNLLEAKISINNSEISFEIDKNITNIRLDTEEKKEDVMKH